MKQFPNENFKNFDFKSYLIAKYDGLFSEDTPTLDKVRLLSSEIKKLPRDNPQRLVKIKEKRSMLKDYNNTMKYWRKLQG